MHVTDGGGGSEDGLRRVWKKGEEIGGRGDRSGGGSTG